jgi:hypothetical protein
MTERIEGEKYTSVTLSPDCRAEIEKVVAATGAKRSTIHETIREWVESQIGGKILSLYLERIGRRAGALNGAKPRPAPTPRPRKTTEPQALTQQGDT